MIVCVHVALSVTCCCNITISQHVHTVVSRVNAHGRLNTTRDFDPHGHLPGIEVAYTRVCIHDSGHLLGKLQCMYNTNVCTLYVDTTYKYPWDHVKYSVLIE